MKKINRSQCESRIQGFTRIIIETIIVRIKIIPRQTSQL